MWWILLALPVTVYFFWGLKAISALRQSSLNEGESEKRIPSVTLAIPFRNERKNLRRNWEKFDNILQTNSTLEIILVDDHSNDRGTEGFPKLINSDRLLILKSNGKGKKAAVQCVIERSSSSILVFTDADTILNLDWLEKMLRPFNNERVKMVLGPVVYVKEPNFFNSFYSLDFLSLIITTEASVLLGRPVMANGANYAIRRDTISRLSHDELLTKEQSGDDVFALHAVVKRYGSGSIFFQNAKEACVKTFAPTNLKSFLLQRIRWGGKSRYYQNVNAQFLTILVFLTNLSILLALILNWQLALILWLLKQLVDYPLLRMAGEKYNRSDAMRVYLAQAIIYPFYITLLAILSQLIPVKWKP